MADPVSIVSGTASIVKAIIDLALKIKNQVDTFRHNREDCRKISELVATVRAVAECLRKTTEKDQDGGGLLGGALKGLKQALERAWDLVVSCQKKNAVLLALDAEGIAVKLRRVYLDVSLNLSAVVLANGAYNTSRLADVNGVVAALRADVAYNTSITRCSKKFWRLLLLFRMLSYVCNRRWQDWCRCAVIQLMMMRQRKRMTLSGTPPIPRATPMRYAHNIVFLAVPLYIGARLPAVPCTPTDHHLQIC